MQSAAVVARVQGSLTSYGLYLFERRTILCNDTRHKFSTLVDCYLSSLQADGYRLLLPVLGLPFAGWC